MLRKQARMIFKRLYSTKFHGLFPKTFASQKSPFVVEASKLKREFRELQSQYHPDVNKNEAEISSLLNKAYNTLKDPLLRSQYLIKEAKGVDLNSDSFKELNNDQGLFEIYEVFEQLQDSTEKAEVDALKKENRIKAKAIENKLEDLYSKENKDYDEIMKQTIKLKYLKTIEQAIKNWELNKPITISH